PIWAACCCCPRQNNAASSCVPYLIFVPISFRPFGALITRDYDLSSLSHFNWFPVEGSSPGSLLIDILAIGLIRHLISLLLHLSGQTILWCDLCHLVDWLWRNRV